MSRLSRSGYLDWLEKGARAGARLAELEGLISTMSEKDFMRLKRSISQC